MRSKEKQIIKSHLLLGNKRGNNFAVVFIYSTIKIDCGNFFMGNTLDNTNYIAINLVQDKNDSRKRENNSNKILQTLKQRKTFFFHLLTLIKCYFPIDFPRLVCSLG